jgi:hypothetical protein
MLGAYGGAKPLERRVAGARARFEHWAIRAVGCPWRYPGDKAVEIRPCLGLDLGRLRGEGFGVAGASARNAWWIGGFAELRLDLRLFDSIRVGISGGPLLPFVRPRFYFEPGVVAHRVPLVALQASGFAAVLF